ncbi:MAG: ABC transporter ATP-binding protein, partial [Planctomycetes bacterium]|nr:ABC transporter ATP-binding protein [Planctomycetota bacterium]
MNPQIITVDTGNPVESAPVRRGVIMRMVRTVLPHRKFLIIGIIASVAYAALHSVSLLGALPVLKVLLEDEGLHGWVDRVIGGMRIEADLIVRQDSADGEATSGLFIQNLSKDSALYQQGARALDEIRTLDHETLRPREWLQRVAAAESGQVVRFEVFPPGADESRATECRITLSDLKFHWRLGGGVASLIPRAESRADRLPSLVYILAAVVIVVVLANVCRFVSEFTITLAVLRGMMDLRRALYAKVLKLPMSHFTRDTGDIVSRFVQDIQDIQRGLRALLGKSVREPLKAIFILSGALWLDWRITLTMVLVAPWAILIFWKIGTTLRKASRKLLRGYGRMITALSETLSAITVVKAYTTENLERRRLWQIDRKMFKQQVKIARLEASLSPALEILGVVTISAATVWMGARVVSQEIELAKFGTLVFVFGMLFDPLRKMADVYTRVLRSAAAGDRLFEVVDASDEAALTEGTIELAPFERSIEFKDVTFVYPEADRPALNAVNLKIERGETIALVGPNGAGKTTLANMIVRFYDPQHGSVLIDGTDIRKVTLRSLRKQIGLVTQDTVVFPIPLADNISYGTRGASRESGMLPARCGRGRS